MHVTACWWVGWWVGWWWGGGGHRAWRWGLEVVVRVVHVYRSVNLVPAKIGTASNSACVRACVCCCVRACCVRVHMRLACYISAQINLCAHHMQELVVLGTSASMLPLLTRAPVGVVSETASSSRE